MQIGSRNVKFGGGPGENFEGITLKLLFCAATWLLFLLPLE